MTDDQLEARIDELVREMQRQEDVEAIKALHRTCIRRLADRDWDDMLTLFADHAVVDLRHGPRRGRDELTAPCRHARLRHPHDGYIISSPVVEIDGDTAVGSWTRHCHLCEFEVTGATIRQYWPWWEGRYATEHVRQCGRWKFRSMRFRLAARDPGLEPEEMARLRERGEVVVLGGPNRPAPDPAGDRS